MGLAQGPTPLRLKADFWEVWGAEPSRIHGCPGGDPLGIEWVRGGKAPGMQGGLGAAAPQKA